MPLECVNGMLGVVVDIRSKEVQRFQQDGDLIDHEHGLQVSQLGADVVCVFSISKTMCWRYCAANLRPPMGYPRRRVPHSSSCPCSSSSSQH